ncbi:MAG: putative quinol monooxygenase [Myxococcota bacterium]
MPSVIATLKVRQDKVDEAKALFAKLASQVSQAEPGTLAYVPHQRKDEPTTFVFYEKYASDEDFQTHGANLRKVGAEFAGVMAGPPEIVFLEEIS